jgi:hypothetical protein
VQGLQQIPGVSGLLRWDGLVVSGEGGKGGWCVEAVLQRPKGLRLAGVQVGRLGSVAPSLKRGAHHLGQSLPSCTAGVGVAVIPRGHVCCCCCSVVVWLCAWLSHP